MPDLSIGEVARRAGIATSAIRYYERVGLLPPAPRRGAQRRYDPQILERLAIVRLGQHVGLRIAEIKWLLDDVPGRPPPERWRRLAGARLAQVDQLITEAKAIRELLQMTLDQKCPKLVERGISLPWRRNVSSIAR
jgi:MerR family transcriptional regulator, redox-sensitive transcriptional activator SoxR